MLSLDPSLDLVNTLLFLHFLSLNHLCCCNGTLSPAFKVVTIKKEMFMPEVGVEISIGQGSIADYYMIIFCFHRTVLFIHHRFLGTDEMLVS